MKKIDISKRMINYNNLLEYGFVLENDIYKYEKDILNNEFKVVVEVINNEIISKIIEVSLNDEYLMVDVESSCGEYVGKIRDEYNLVINDIINKCTYRDVYKSPQARLIIKYIKDKYNDEIEFLWDDDNAIFRNKKNKKWYLALLIVSENKISGNSSKKIEVIDLRYQKEKISEIIDNKKIYPGYHMSKKSWITIKLDESVDIEEIYKLIDNSYEISLNK